MNEYTAPQLARITKRVPHSCFSSSGVSTLLKEAETGLAPLPAFLGGPDPLLAQDIAEYEYEYEYEEQLSSDAPELGRSAWVFAAPAEGTGESAKEEEEELESGYEYEYDYQYIVD